MVVVAVLGVTSAIVYGASDFLGGLASRRISPFAATAIGNGLAAVIVAVVTVITPHAWSFGTLGWGAIAGLGGAVGTAGLYACLAMGPMSVLSPTVAALYAIVPAVVGVALGERFGPIGYVALAVVFLAGLLLAATPESDGRRLRPRALALAAVAGLGFALYIIAMDRAPEGSGFTVLLVELVVSVVLVLAFAGVRGVAVRRRGAVRPSVSGPGADAAPSPALAGPLAVPRSALRDRRAVALSLGTGLLGAVANLLLVAGLQIGDLAVMSVLNSLYPLGTVLLAILVLKERLTPVQGIGILLALGGAAALALG